MNEKPTYEELEQKVKALEKETKGHLEEQTGETFRESLTLNELLLDSLPHPAMLITTKRIVLTANKIARNAGVKVGRFCWDTFGHREYIPEKQKQRLKDNPECRKNDISCTFCLTNILLETGSTQRDSEVSAFGKIWDTWWVPVKEDIYLHYAIDITERKRMEEERKKLESQLQQAQKMEAIGTLAGGIAHDFNNILFPLVGYAEMLKEDLPTDHRFQANADTMLSSALRARDLVQQILTFSRKSTSEIKPLKLQLIVKEVLKLLKSSIPKTIKIQQNIDSDCGLVNADPTKFHQIVMNLATNAYHAMEETGGKLIITLKQIHVEQDIQENSDLLPGTYARLTVEDTGIGMEKKVMDKVFDPYFTTKEAGKGTGLGLPVVHGIVKECNGDIRIYSESGKGTSIHVYLPIVEKRAAKRVGDTGAVIGGTEGILLIDDEVAVAKMEQQLLERQGYSVTTRIGSIEALEAFKANPDKFDLIVTDMTMPNMTGIQLAQEIKKIKVDIPIIICTEFSKQLTDEKCHALCINGLVMKPVIINELAANIRNVFDASGES